MIEIYSDTRLCPSAALVGGFLFSLKVPKRNANIVKIGLIYIYIHNHTCNQL